MNGLDYLRGLAIIRIGPVMFVHQIAYRPQLRETKVALTTLRSQAKLFDTNLIEVYVKFVQRTHAAAHAESVNETDRHLAQRIHQAMELGIDESRIRRTNSMQEPPRIVFRHWYK